MKTRTTLILLLITLGVGAWLLLKESGTPHNLGGHLLFDWSGTAQKQEQEELKVDVQAKDVTGIDLKSSTVEVSLRREADGTWSITKGLQDRADGALVKTLLDYLGTAKIGDVISSSELKDGTVSESLLGLDDTGAWRVSWLGADNKVLCEIRAGKTAPLGGAGYVQLTGQQSRTDIYIVKPDLRPELARPLDSFRDPRACRYKEEQVQKMVVRKGEGEVELSRTMIPDAEPGEWVITRPLANAPAEQKIAKEFIATICGLKVKEGGWLPYTETTDKPLVELTVFPPVQGSKGATLSFYPDPSAPEATAICRDKQRKTAFKVAKDTVDYFALADSPNPFRSHKLPVLIDPAVISTVEVRTPQDSVVVVRVGNKWSWRPLDGGAWADAAVERLEKLIETLTEAEVIDFASDSLTDPKAFALDQPDFVVTFAAGSHDSLEKLTPIGVLGPDKTVVANRDESVPLQKRNYRSLRITIRQDGQIFANYAGDQFVYRIGPEITSAIPMTFNKWRTLALPGFSIGGILSIKRTIGTQPPLEMAYNAKAQARRWTVTQAGADVTPLYAEASIESLVNKLGTLSVASWLDKPDDANKALAAPAVILEIQHKVYGDKVADDKVVTDTFTLAPLPSAGAPLCYGKYTGAEGPFLIKIEVLREATADLLIKK